MSEDVKRRRHDRLSRLNEAFILAGEKLYKMHLQAGHIEVRDGVTFGWAKHFVTEKWGLYIGYHDDNGDLECSKPILECSVDDRMVVAHCLGGLVEVLRARSDEHIEMLDKSIAAVLIFSAEV